MRQTLATSLAPGVLCAVVTQAAAADTPRLTDSSGLQPNHLVRLQIDPTSSVVEILPQRWRDVIDSSFTMISANCLDCGSPCPEFERTVQVVLQATTDVEAAYGVSDLASVNYSYAWGSGADTNEHVAHIMNYVGQFADSDWDDSTTGPGSQEGLDTLTTCTTCHNVHGARGTHGSTNEAMMRDGSLAGRTGYGFSYVVEDTGSGGYPQVTSVGATKDNSVGAVLRNNTSTMCAGSMCHGDPAPPYAASYDASGAGWGSYLEYYRPGPG